MHARQSPLRAPQGQANWFAVDVPGRGAHAFRLPRAAVRDELLALFGASRFGMTGTREEIQAAVAAGLAARDVRTTATVRATDDAVGAVLGAMWRHETLDLDTERGAFRDDLPGLRRYGSAVMDEIQDAGYTDEQQRELIEAVLGRFLSSVLPAPGEVAARAATFPAA